MSPSPEPLGQLFTRSLASIKQNHGLSHFSVPKRFNVNTIYRGQFHESV